MKSRGEIKYLLGIEMPQIDSSSMNLDATCLLSGDDSNRIRIMEDGVVCFHLVDSNFGASNGVIP